MEIIPPDFVISYWVFGWFVLYMLGFVVVAPKLMIMVALFGNFCLMLLLKIRFKDLLRNIIILFPTKLLPLFIVWNQPITRTEVVYSIVFLCGHFIWLFLHWTQVSNIAWYLYKTKHQQRYIMLSSYWYEKVVSFFKSKPAKN
jgi:hypothetical protein